jgi:hypothetical protein
MELLIGKRFIEILWSKEKQIYSAILIFLYLLRRKEK